MVAALNGQAFPAGKVRVRDACTHLVFRSATAIHYVAHITTLPLVIAANGFAPISLFERHHHEMALYAMRCAPVRSQLF